MWKDQDGIERLRYMRPNKNGQFSHQKTGYFVLRDAQGRFLDIDGEIIPDGPLQITLQHLFDSAP